MQRMCAMLVSIAGRPAALNHGDADGYVNPTWSKTRWMAIKSCSLKSSGRLLESVSNYRSRWMVVPIATQVTIGQDPAYRATLLLITLCDFILITIWAAVFIFVLIFNYLMVDDKGDSIYSGPFLFSQRL
jgi:hypothetical protein